MQALILSDSHGHRGFVEEVLEKHPQASVVYFLGDGLREMEDLALLNRDRRFVMVAGNCDLAATEPLCREDVAGDRRLFLTHGHLFSVKTGLHSLYYAALERNADVVLFGHTHQPLHRFEGDVFLFNPGSVKDGCYGLLTHTSRGFSLENLHL